MAEGMTGSALEAMRALTLQLDAAVEALLEAHGFTLAEMKAAAMRAEACFDGPAGMAPTAWRLDLAQAVDGALAVSLRQGDREAPHIALQIAAGPAAQRSLAEAVGLAMSFVAFADRLRPAG